MKVSIQTRKGLNLKLEVACIEDPTLVLTNCNGNYYTFVYRGQMFEAKHLGGLKEIKTLDLREKSSPVALTSLLPSVPVADKPTPVYESAGMSLVPPGKSAKVSKDKYQGEMIWSHKTAPEIVIRSPSGKMIKDVDTASMYKRR